MYSSGGLLLIAIGAMLYWAISYKVAGVNLHMIGLILMAVGAIGFLFSTISAATPRRRVL